MAWAGEAYSWAGEAWEAASGIASEIEAVTHAAEDAWDAASGVAKKIKTELGDSNTTKVGHYLGNRNIGPPIEDTTPNQPPSNDTSTVSPLAGHKRSHFGTPIHRSINTSQALSNMVTKSNGKGDHQDEVQVMPHHGPMSKIVEDYHTINLTYFGSQTFTTAGLPINTFVDRVFRLNSIYDIDETSSNQQQPLGRDTWASIYQYYRVLSCDVELKLINRDPSDTMVAGIVLEEDTATLTTTIDNFMMRKNAIRSVIPGYLTGGNGLGIIRYHYNPSNWDHHVQETGVEERWTPINQTPSNEHRAVFRMAPLRSRLEANRVLDYEWHIQMKFTVQFREANKTILTTGSIPA